MGKIFQPLQDLVGGCYDFCYDAACKVWNLAKPLALIGLLFDLMTGKLGWIDHILVNYRAILQHTSGTHWLVLVLGVLVLLSWKK